MNVLRKLCARRVLTLSGSLLGTIALVGASAGAASAAPLFPQCPPVGSNQGCSQLIVVKKDGTATVKVDPAAPKNGYDGVEDTLIGVQNNSGRSVKSINLASPTQSIMAFDGDGLCNPSQWPAPTSHTTPPGCPGPQGFGKTGYEGPGNSFSNISSNFLTGTVNFKPSIGPGKSAYFALEEALQAGQLRSSTSGPIAGPVTVTGNVVTFELTCVGTQGKPCNGTVQLQATSSGKAAAARKKHRGLTIGKAKIRIVNGGTVRVTIKLNKLGRKLHKKHKHLAATIVVKIGGKKYKIGKVHFK